MVLHQIIISEGSKAYLTKHVNEDNQDQLFKSYKDLCAITGNYILECNPDYKFPGSLATTNVEMAHIQNIFMQILPASTDFGKSKNETNILEFVEDFVCHAIKK